MIYSGTTNYARLVELDITLGQPQNAVEYYRKAILISEGLSATDPANETLRLELAQVYFVMGKALGGPSTANVGDTKGGSEYLRKSLTIEKNWRPSIQAMLSTAKASPLTTTR